MTKHGDLNSAEVLAIITRSDDTTSDEVGHSPQPQRAHHAENHDRPSIDHEANTVSQNRDLNEGRDNGLTVCIPSSHLRPSVD